MTFQPRRAVRLMEEYIPGEQPQGKGYIKINTNENPYPPSPKVCDVLKNFDLEKARKYPDPLCVQIREILGKMHNLKKEQIIVGNGSDEILRLLFDAYLDKGDKVAILYPTYTLYETLAQMREAEVIKFNASDGKFPFEIAKSKAKMIFIANPNPPIGTFFPTELIEKVCTTAKNSLVIVDEAYVEFAEDNSMAIINKYPNLIVVRTLSKSYSFAGMRVGFGFGSVELIKNLYKIKDSYNVNAISQAMAIAALKDQKYTNEKIKEIKEEREKLTEELKKLGFTLSSSSGNFVFTIHEKGELIYQELKKKKILIRYLKFPKLFNGIRITIGTPAQNKKVIREIKTILKIK